MAFYCPKADLGNWLYFVGKRRSFEGEKNGGSIDKHVVMGF
jgi:hypothetical protein